MLPPRTTPEHEAQFPISTPPTNYVWRPSASRNPLNLSPSLGLILSLSPRALSFCWILGSSAPTSPEQPYRGLDSFASRLLSVLPLVFLLSVRVLLLFVSQSRGHSKYPPRHSPTVRSVCLIRVSGSSPLLLPFPQASLSILLYPPLVCLLRTRRLDPANSRPWHQKGPDSASEPNDSRNRGQIRFPSPETSHEGLRPDRTLSLDRPSKDRCCSPLRLFSVNSASSCLVLLRPHNVCRNRKPPALA